MRSVAKIIPSLRCAVLLALLASCFAVCYEPAPCEGTSGWPTDSTWAVTYGTCVRAGEESTTPPNPAPVGGIKACIAQRAGQRTVTGAGDGVGSGTCGVFKLRRQTWVRFDPQYQVNCQGNGFTGRKNGQMWRLSLDDEEAVTGERCGGVHNGHSGCTI